MQWTKREPIEAGWYWVRGPWSEGEARIVCVEVYRGGFGLDVHWRGCHYPVRPSMAEWAGPIPEPEEGA